MLAETKIVLAAFVKCCHDCTSLSAASRKDISRRLPEMSAICLVLNLIGARKLLNGFIAKFILDASLPLQSEVVVSIFPNRKKALDFLGEQYRAKPRVMVPQTHHHLEDMEPTPYLTVRELGEGGSGYVDEIKDVTSNKIFARKLLRCTPKATRGAEIRLEEEVQILKRLLNHNHIIQLVNTYRREHLLGLIMSPVAKASLHDIMELPTGDRVWARSVLRRSPGCLTSALADIHSLKIRHKDITPKNILICDDDVILTDFGISVDVSEMTSTNSTGPTAKTRQYCSPEVANNEKRGRSSDVFSLGCVILIVLTLLRENDPRGLAEVLSFRPFSQSVDQLLSWIQHQTELEQESLGAMWLGTCRDFIQEAPQSRLTARDALEKIFSSSASEELLKDSFCGECSSNNDNPDYAEKRHKSRLSAEVAQGKVHNAQSVQPEDDMAADSTNTENLTYNMSRRRQPLIFNSRTIMISSRAWENEHLYDHPTPRLVMLFTAWKEMRQAMLHYDKEYKGLGDSPSEINQETVANLVCEALLRQQNSLFNEAAFSDRNQTRNAGIERAKKDSIIELTNHILRFKAIIGVQKLEDWSMVERIERRLKELLDQVDSNRECGTVYRSDYFAEFPERVMGFPSVDPMMNKAKDFSPRYTF